MASQCWPGFRRSDAVEGASCFVSQTEARSTVIATHVDAQGREDGSVSVDIEPLWHPTRSEDAAVGGLLRRRAVQPTSLDADAQNDASAVDAKAAGVEESSRGLWAGDGHESEGLA